MRRAASTAVLLVLAVATALLTVPVLDARPVPAVETLETPGLNPHGSSTPPGVALAGHALREQIRDIVAQAFTTGISVGVVEHGQVAWVEGFGTVDAEGRVPTRPDTVYRVGSFSKTFLAMAVVALAEAGRLTLDQPVRELAPEIALFNSWEDTDPVRVTHLLEHTAGFDEMRFNELVATDDQLDWTPEQVLALNPRSRRVRWRPGTRHAYSHPGYTFAGHLVEKLSGQPWDSFIAGRILAPLGMRQATFRHGPEVAARLAPAYDTGSLDPIPHLDLHHRPGSSLYVSAADMSRFVAALVSDGALEGKPVIPASWIDTMERGASLPYPGMGSSYGLGLYTRAHGGAVAYGHGGWMPGYFSAYRYYPSVGAGYVLLTNEPLNPWAMGQIEALLRGYLLRDAPRETPAPRVALPPHVLDRYVGSYRQSGPEVAIASAFVSMPICRVQRQGPSLVWTGDGCRHRELVPTGPRTFRERDQIRPSLWFGRDPDGVDMAWDASSFTYHERVPGWWGPMRSVVQLGLGLIVFGGLLWPVWWLPRRMFGPARGRLGLRALPSLGAWAVVIMIHTLFTTAPHELGRVSVAAVVVFASSWAVAVCALGGLTVALRTLRRGMGDDDAAAAVLALLISGALVAVATHLAFHGLLGLRTWAW